MTGDTETRHDLTNHLSVIRGLSELLLAEIDLHDPRREDVLEIHKSASAALALLHPDEAGASQ